MASKKHSSRRSSRKPRSSRGTSSRHGSFLGMRVEYKRATDADRKALLRVLDAGSTAPEGAILDWIRRETPELVLRSSLAKLRVRAPTLVRSGRSSRLTVTNGGKLSDGRHGNAQAAMGIATAARSSDARIADVYDEAYEVSRALDKHRIGNTAAAWNDTMRHFRAKGIPDGDILRALRKARLALAIREGFKNGLIERYRAEVRQA
jgi:hypothetical protein